ncbi:MULTISPECIES: heavy-metal-associated domain-containing protein [Micromonospora]|uniref:Copper ion binding protein n=1 Tax=Micromonospora yangpuensis TaxID=683228 RepID=A0A1C6U102_9ACTN|nr:cation transporter [Micromonospora yangpuensis]GGM11297.1 metal-binding protein [Micromonospora yangpuensis]SCL47745.1 copper ion binding protein [Micromonospora yangpuensis]
MVTDIYQVQGMTCGHCVQAVSAEVGALAGVDEVQVDLASGQVTVTSAEPLDPAAVRAAVDEAGYDLVDR